MHWSGAYRILQERISGEIRERLNDRNRSRAEDADKERVESSFVMKGQRADMAQLDCIQWTINAFRRSNEMSLSGTLERTMGFLFASAHQVPPVGARSNEINGGMTHTTSS